MRTLVIALFSLALASGAAAQPTGCTPVLPGVADGTFEAGTPWPLWTVQTSTNFGSPLCDLSCGGVGPFAGSNWAWFGGAGTAAEADSAGQTLTIPASPNVYLHFQMRISGIDTTAPGVLNISVDGSPVATYPEPAVPETAYTERFVSLGGFANGAPHALLFSYNKAAGAQSSNYHVDNVEVVTCTTPVSLERFSAE